MSADGVATVNFGAFPGAGEATVDVTAQSGFVVGSRLEAWLIPISTADHSIDEHMMEECDVRAFYLADGSFRIRVSPRIVSQLKAISIDGYIGQAQKNLMYGQYSVGWVWI